MLSNVYVALSFFGGILNHSMGHGAQQIVLLKAQLEASELRHRVHELNTVITQLQLELQESNTLLRRQRLPPRIKVTATQRQQIAARQKWTCAGGAECPLRVVNPPGLFTPEALYDVDHVQPWAESGKHFGNLRALCAHCHSVVTRRSCEARVDKARFE